MRNDQGRAALVKIAIGQVDKVERPQVERGHHGRAMIGQVELVALVDEVQLLREWQDKTTPIVAALAIYGESVNLPALVEKARELSPQWDGSGQ